MPVPSYGLIKAHPVAGRVFPPHDPTRDQPHYHIHLVAGSANFDVAVNVLSSDSSQVLFHINSSLQPPHAAALQGLTPGAHTIGVAGASGLGLDFIRQHLVARGDMTLLDIGPTVKAGAEMERVLAHAVTTPLHTSLDALVQSAIARQDAELYAFGSHFNNPGANPFFGFSPDHGVHDIHMNQGNPTHSSFANDDGIYTDGALLLRLPGTPTWQGMFIAFQTQSWHTDNHGRPA